MGIGFRKKIIKVGPKLKETTTDKNGRQRARKMFPMEPCEVCYKFPSQRHHKDGNPKNNIRKNIAFLCPKHHVHADRLPLLKKIALSGGIASLKKSVRDKKTGRFIERTP